VGSFVEIAWDLARRFDLETESRSVEEVTKEVCEILLDDLTRAKDIEMKTLLAFAPEERIDT